MFKMRLKLINHHQKQIIQLNQINSIKAKKKLSIIDSITSVYEVRQGDSLWKIGREHGLNWRFIYMMNKNVIKNPEVIHAGLKITVPNKLLIKIIFELYDLCCIASPYGFTIHTIVDILLYFMTGGSIIEEDIKNFCKQKSVDAVFSHKIWLIYKALGKSHLWAKVYDYVNSFFSYGLCKMIDSSQK